MENAIKGAEPRSIALAALYICESLLLELEESGKLTGAEIQNLLKDAVEALRETGKEGGGNDWTVAGEIVEAMRDNRERMSG